MGLLISFGRGFRAKFQWWIVVGSVWWAVGCGGTVGLGLRVEVRGIGEVGRGVSVSGSTRHVVLLGLRV